MLYFSGTQLVKSEFGGLTMKRQLQGIALILIGILLAIYTIIDPWLLVLGGDVGRVLIPVASVAISIIGLVLCFTEKDNK